MKPDPPKLFYYNVRTGVLGPTGRPAFAAQYVVSPLAGRVVVPMAVIAMLRGSAPVLASMEIWVALTPEAIRPAPRAMVAVIMSILSNLEDEIERDKEAACPGHNRLRKYDFN